MGRLAEASAVPAEDVGSPVEFMGYVHITITHRKAGVCPFPFTA